jgi:hypothetical protein
MPACALTVQIASRQTIRHDLQIRLTTETPFDSTGISILETISVFRVTSLASYEPKRFM